MFSVYIHWLFGPATPAKKDWRELTEGRSLVLSLSPVRGPRPGRAVGSQCEAAWLPERHVHMSSLQNNTKVLFFWLRQCFFANPTEGRRKWRAYITTGKMGVSLLKKNRCLELVLKAVETSCCLSSLLIVTGNEGEWAGDTGISTSPRQQGAQPDLDASSPASWFRALPAVHFAFQASSLSRWHQNIAPQTSFRWEKTGSWEGGEAEGKSLGPFETSLTLQTKSVSTAECGRAFTMSRKAGGGYLSGNHCQTVWCLLLLPSDWGCLT